MSEMIRGGVVAYLDCADMADHMSLGFASAHGREDLMTMTPREVEAISIVLSGLAQAIRSKAANLELACQPSSAGVQ